MNETAEFHVLDLMQQGGIIMWFLLGLSVLALTLALERGITVFMARRRNRQTRRRLPAFLVAAQGRGESSSAIRRSPGPLDVMLHAGVDRASRGPREAERAMEAAAGLEMRRMQRGMNILATVANLAPLLGFLGTAVGMMLSFDVLAKHGLSDPTLVAEGIKTALTTTVGGLAVAIPVQFAYNLLTGQLETIIVEMEHAGAVVLAAIEDAHGS